MRREWVMEQILARGCGCRICYAGSVCQRLRRLAKYLLRMKI